MGSGFVYYNCFIEVRDVYFSIIEIYVRPRNARESYTVQTKNYEHSIQQSLGCDGANLGCGIKLSCGGAKWYRS